MNNVSQECVDAFKAFTGKHGQAAGKELLQNVAKVNVLSDLSAEKEAAVIEACSKPPISPAQAKGKAQAPEDDGDAIRKKWNEPKPKARKGTAEADA